MDELSEIFLEEVKNEEKGKEDNVLVVYFFEKIEYVWVWL